jgi:hypothetical protein
MCFLRFLAGRAEISGGLLRIVFDSFMAGNRF